MCIRDSDWSLKVPKTEEEDSRIERKYDWSLFVQRKKLTRERVEHWNLSFAALGYMNKDKFNEESRRSFDSCLMCYKQQLTNKCTYLDTVQKSKPV